MTRFSVLFHEGSLARLSSQNELRTTWLGRRTNLSGFHPTSKSLQSDAKEGEGTSLKEVVMSNYAVNGSNASKVKENIVQKVHELDLQCDPSLSR